MFGGDFLLLDLLCLDLRLTNRLLHFLKTRF
jgi:hypothetical protein